MEPTRLTVAEIAERLARGDKAVFLDSRSAHAWESSDVQIPGSIRVSPDEVYRRLDTIPREGLIVPYCT